MATWLYLAGKAKASPANTYRYAQQGFVWRPYYTTHKHLQASCNVKHLEHGDTLYIGYRQAKHVYLLGRCTIECPDTHIGPSQVFCNVPKHIENDMRSDGYTNDPVLGTLVGIFVSAIEPLEDCVDLPPEGKRNSVIPFDFGAQRREATSTAAAVSRNDYSSPTPTANAPASTNRPYDKSCSGLYVGVDVAGRPTKGLTLCFLQFTAGKVNDISFGELPYTTLPQVPPTADLRETARRGDLEQLAGITWKAAAALSAEFQANVVSRQPQGVFIDSPTAFSRNTLGHGRATEKVSYRGVSFQCTPSVTCNRPHGGDWSWLIYGMVVYASLRHAHLTEETWRQSLTNGMYRDFIASKTSIRVRECFPTATISVLREQDNAVPEVANALASFRDRARGGDEVSAVCEYLEHGVRAVKTGAALYDRADALVAALLALPQVMPTTFREMERAPRDGVNWAGSDGDFEKEGKIAVVERLP